VQLGSTVSEGEVTLRTRDDALTARVAPAGERFSVEVSARNWTAPLAPAVTFDQLALNALASLTALEIKKLQASLNGGSVTGTGTVNWEQGVSVKAQLDIAGVELKPFSGDTQEPRLSGRLDAKGSVSAVAPNAAGLFDQVRIDSVFTLREGALHGISMAPGGGMQEANGGGGYVPFDVVSGRLSMERRAYRFTQLNMKYGALAARGDVSIASNKALAGRIEARIPAPERTMIVPLTLGGTMAAPAIYPTR
jgi:hypothetical protein